MQGITFGDKHTFNDWNLYLASLTISVPKIKENTIEVPGRDGVIDLSDILDNDIKYDNRTIEAEFITVKPISLFPSIYSEVMNYLHGKKMKIILDKDTGFYYIGRVKVDKTETDKRMGKIVIKAEVDPYKYEIYSSTEDWIWDTFSFEDGIIREYKDLQVNGTMRLTIIGLRKVIHPIITTSKAIILTFNNKNYAIPKGKSELLDVNLVQGDNYLLFTGNATISIEYRGGSL